MKKEFPLFLVNSCKRDTGDVPDTWSSDGIPSLLEVCTARVCLVVWIGESGSVCKAICC